MLCSWVLYVLATPTLVSSPLESRGGSLSAGVVASGGVSPGGLVVVLLGGLHESWGWDGGRVASDPVLAWIQDAFCPAWSWVVGRLVPGASSCW